MHFISQNYDNEIVPRRGGNYYPSSDVLMFIRLKKHLTKGWREASEIFGRLFMLLYWKLSTPQNIGKFYTLLMEGVIPIIKNNPRKLGRGTFHTE